jgi:UDP-GlcNAc:undecaprenyl-phosphate/decaprenyl-phosphate GlcNAc-1-phosphate transferase
MKYIITALAVSFLVTLIIIRVQLARTRGKGRSDSARHGVWTREPGLPGLRRMGGIGVAAGLLASLLARWTDDAPYATASAGLGLTLIACALPVFVAGLSEDGTHKVSAAIRLAAAVVSAALAGWLLGAWIVRVDLPVLDTLIADPVASVLFTCLLVAGVTHAYNIIDGFNGLAGGVASLILLGVAYVAFKVGDVLIVTAALTAVGAIFGFMLLNFPRGLIFLGDGGAYLLGFWTGVLLVLLVGRNHAVSAWFPVLLCSYPACELLFSIYRRQFVRRTHPGQPDLAHLHHLIYKRLVRWLVGTSLPTQRTQRNSLTAPYLWILTSIGVAPAVIFWQTTPVLQLGCALFAATYVFAYARIVKFRAPRWWVLHRRRPEQD